MAVVVTPLLVAVALQAYDDAVGMVTTPDLRSRFEAMQKALEAVGVEPLLPKYMQHILDLEGVTFLGDQFHGVKRFSVAELAKLREIEEGLES